MRERMLAGELYIANDSQLVQDFTRAQILTHRLNAMNPHDADYQAVLIELLGGFGEVRSRRGSGAKSGNQLVPSSSMTTCGSEVASSSVLASPLARTPWLGRVQWS